MCAHVLLHTCVHICAEVREQLEGDGSLLLPCGSQGLNFYQLICLTSPVVFIETMSLSGTWSSRICQFPPLHC